jgi:hypothetical protein
VISVSAWEAIFLLLVLKIPMIYLAVVVIWAIRAEPVPGDGGEPIRAVVPLTPCGWSDWRRRRAGRPLATRRPPGPRGRPTRRRSRVGVTA